MEETIHCSDGNSDTCDLLVREKSFELWRSLEELMEHIQSHSREESSESFEERYVLIISSYPPDCLSRAVTLTDADVRKNSTSEATLQLPIHLACSKGAPLSIVKSLLDADARNNKCGDRPSIRKTDKWGDLPIHIACSRASAALSEHDQQMFGQGMLTERVEFLFDDVDNVQDRLETFAAYNAVETIRLLLKVDKDKTTLRIKDVYESTPLHTAARYNAPVEVISMLLEGNDNDGAKSGLYTEGLHGQFPLTVACRSGNPRPEVLRVLLEHDDASASLSSSENWQPSTILRKDATLRLPIHVFMLRNTCEKCLRILLEAMLGRSRIQNNLNLNGKKARRGFGFPNRISILSIGLDAWKQRWRNEMIPGLDGSLFYERDFTTQDKLDVICTEARAFYETCVSLELVVWKMSCLSGIRRGEEEQGRKDDDDDNNNTRIIEKGERFKQNRRIVSGAGIIVPNVLSYLEDEPVEKILEHFRSYGYLGKNN